METDLVRVVDEPNIVTDAPEGSWHRLELGLGQSFALSRARILNVLAELTMRAVRSGSSCRELAAFDTDELSPDRAIYLSPAWTPWAGALIREFHGRPCERPAFERGDLHLLSGTSDAAQRLLGGALASEQPADAAPDARWRDGQQRLPS